MHAVAKLCRQMLPQLSESAVAPGLACDESDDLVTLRWPDVGGERHLTVARDDEWLRLRADLEGLPKRTLESTVAMLRLNASLGPYRITGDDVGPVLATEFPIANLDDAWTQQAFVAVCGPMMRQLSSVLAALRGQGPLTRVTAADAQLATARTRLAEIVANSGLAFSPTDGGWSLARGETGIAVTIAQDGCARLAMSMGAIPPDEALLDHLLLWQEPNAVAKVVLASGGITEIVAEWPCEILDVGLFQFLAEELPSLAKHLRDEVDGNPPTA
jgi:hypothetical protein